MTSDAIIKAVRGCYIDEWDEIRRQENLRKPYKLVLEGSRENHEMMMRGDISTGLFRDTLVGDREPKSIESPDGPKMMSWHQPIPPTDKAVSAPSRAKKLALRAKRKRKGK